MPNDLFGTQLRIQVMNIYDFKRAISSFRKWYADCCSAKKRNKNCIMFSKEKRKTFIAYILRWWWIQCFNTFGAHIVQNIKHFVVAVVAVVRLVAMAKSFSPFPRCMNSNKPYIFFCVHFCFIRVMPFMEECWTLKMWRIILLFYSHILCTTIFPLSVPVFRSFFHLKLWLSYFSLRKILQDYIGTSEQTKQAITGGCNAFVLILNWLHASKNVGSLAMYLIVNGIPKAWCFSTTKIMLHFIWKIRIFLHYMKILFQKIHEDLLHLLNSIIGAIYITFIHFTYV